MSGIVFNPVFEKARLVVRGGGSVEVAHIRGPGNYHCGSLEVDVDLRDAGFSWSLSSIAHEPVHIDAVSLVWDAGAAGEQVRAFINGYQSWSRAGAAVLGETIDPSTAPGSIDLSRGIYHADPKVAEPGELRSEMVTVIDPGTGAPLICLGFQQAIEHDSTFRLRKSGDRIEVTAEAYLGGVRLQPADRLVLHSVEITRGGSAPALLEGWAARAGSAGRARTDAPYQVGWCSWYYYFHNLSEKDLLENLSLSAEWPFEVFQIDDGYQAHIGDWLTTNDNFESDLSALADRIAEEGRRPGIWIAPFLVGPESSMAKERPEMLAETIGADAPLVGMVNPGWGGLTYVLDTTRDESLERLETLSSELVSAGFTYLKLDFTYAPSLPGRYADPSFSPARRVRRGLEAIRRGAGADAFLLGCGCPLGQAIGIVDGMRIGPDVAPFWEPVPEQFSAPGYEPEAPSTLNAWRNTLARSFMHGRLWLNDPDCMILRATQTLLSPAAVRAWAYAVAVSGGMAMVSDALSLLDAEAKTLLDEVLEVGREADDAARKGSSPRCEDLLVNKVPSQLAAPGIRLVGDPRAGSARLERQLTQPP